MTIKQFNQRVGLCAGLLTAGSVFGQTVNASWINFTDSGATGLAHLFYDSPSSNGVNSDLSLENSNGRLFLYGGQSAELYSDAVVGLYAGTSIGLYSDTIYLGQYGGINAPKITVVNSNGWATADIVLTPKGGGRLIVQGGSTFNGAAIFSAAPTVGGSPLITQAVLNNTLGSYVQTNGSGHVGVGGSAAGLSGAWMGAAAIGANAQDKVIVGPLNSSYYGATIGAHNSIFNQWTNLNITGLNLIFRSNGESETMRITQGGRVGIGTQNPADLLTVNGNVRAMAWSGGGFVGYDAPDGGNHVFSLVRGSGSNHLGISAFEGIGFATSATAGPSTNYSMFINGAGNVGLGTNLPQAKLHVAGSAVIEGTLLSPSSAGRSISTYGPQLVLVSELMQGVNFLGGSERFEIVIEGGWYGSYNRVTYRVEARGGLRVFRTDNQVEDASADSQHQVIVYQNPAVINDNNPDVYLIAVQLGAEGNWQSHTITVRDLTHSKWLDVGFISMNGQTADQIVLARPEYASFTRVNVTPRRALQRIAVLPGGDLSMGQFTASPN